MDKTNSLGPLQHSVQVAQLILIQIPCLSFALRFLIYSRWYATRSNLGLTSGLHAVSSIGGTWALTSIFFEGFLGTVVLDCASVLPPPFAPPNLQGSVDQCLVPHTLQIGASMLLV